MLMAIAFGISCTHSSNVAISTTSRHCDEVYPGARAAMHQAEASLKSDHPARALVFCAGASSTLEAKCADEKDPTVVALRARAEAVCHRDAPLLVAREAAGDVTHARRAGDAPPLTACLRLGRALQMLRENHHESDAADVVRDDGAELACQTR